MPNTSRRLKEAARKLLPRSASVHRILTGPLHGAHIHTSWHDYPAAILGTTEVPLLHWFAENVKPGETWLDVGAHYGYTAIALSRLVGGSGRVFAFEPVVATAGCLARTRTLNDLQQLTIVPLALGASSVVSQHLVPAGRGMADYTLLDSPLTETIFSVSLDSLWPSISGSADSIDGIKIDVQGMELDVLRGMLEILRASSPKLVVELHRGVDRDELREILASAGYTGVPEPIEEGDEARSALLDDMSYVFTTEVLVCA